MMNWLKALRKALTEPVTSVGAINNFTPRAQQVLALARKEADRFHHNFVDTEHLLLGLIKLGQGVAFNVLTRLRLDLETVRSEIEKQVDTGPDQKKLGNIPYSPTVRSILAYASKEARKLSHTYVGTEHILLGMLREGNGVAGRILENLGVEIEQTRKEILKELDPNFSSGTDKTRTQNLEEMTAMPQDPDSTSPKPDSIDLNKRYDVYCMESNQTVIVYHNALFKSTRKLFQQHQYDSLSVYVELEQANGKTILLARTSIIKFCETGTPLGSEAAPEKMV